MSFDKLTLPMAFATAALRLTCSATGQQSPEAPAIEALLIQAKLSVALWFQGSASAPYLEDSEVTSRDFWNRIRRGFRGQLFMFVLWVN